MKTWVAAQCRDLAVVGLATRVETLERLQEETVEHNSGAISMLLSVSVKWRSPIAGMNSIPVVAAHLHNHIAKKAGSKDYKQLC